MRKLGIPNVIDRVILQVIIQVLIPIYEEQFSNNGNDWIVDIDLQSFFDEVNQDKLILDKEKLSKVKHSRSR